MDTRQRDARPKWGEIRSGLPEHRQRRPDRQAIQASGWRPAGWHAERLCSILLHSLFDYDVQEGKVSWGTLRAYYEADFLGTGITSNNNQSNSYVMRQRVVWGQELGRT